VRGFLAGVVHKKLGLTLQSEKARWRAGLSRDRAAGGLTMLQRLVDAAAVEAEIERARTPSGEQPDRRPAANDRQQDSPLQFAASAAPLPTVSRVVASLSGADGAHHRRLSARGASLPCRCHAFFQFLHGRLAEL
jgi:hypothetical protein